MGRKSVANRTTVVLVKNSKIEGTGKCIEPHLLEDNDDSTMFFSNRKEAKDHVDSEKENLISKHGEDVMLVIALLDWEISFKKQNIKTIISG